MKNRSLFISGFIAPIVYVITVFLGGLITIGYSHIAQPVSDLIAVGAPNKFLLDILFVIYNLLTIAFGIGIFKFIRENPQKIGELIGTLAAIVLISEGIFGIFDLIFSEDAGGMISASISTTGMLHIVFAGLCSLATMAAIILFGFYFRKFKTFQSFSVFSFIAVTIVFLSGGLTAFSMSTTWQINGLLERITMGSWLLWLFIIAWLFSFSFNKQDFLLPG